MVFVLYGEKKPLSRDPSTLHHSTLSDGVLIVFFNDRRSRCVLCTSARDDRGAAGWEQGRGRRSNV